MTDQIDVMDAARHLLAQTAQEEEANYLEIARAKGYADAFLRMKRGLKVQAFLDTPLGKMFCDKCSETIADACEIWITVDDAQAVATALTNARGARSAMEMFSRILVDAKDAERILEEIEATTGETG